MKGAFNPWREYDPANDASRESCLIRRSNLEAYLDKTKLASVLIYGEAPGYRGCKFSGIAFTDENLADDFPQYGLDFLRRSSRPQVHTKWVEQSSRVIWGVIAPVWKDVRLWNIFPIHPCRAGEPLTNRRPTRSELDETAKLALALLAETLPEKIVAVGSVASEQLTRLGVDHEHVRHPAYGGRRDCERQLRKILELGEATTGQTDFADKLQV